MTSFGNFSKAAEKKIRMVKGMLRDYGVGAWTQHSFACADYAIYISPMQFKSHLNSTITNPKCLGLFVQFLSISS